MSQPQVPLKLQLGALYEDNIAAKILKAAINGLENNVSQLFILARGAAAKKIHRILP
jgi:hypothetical protein